MKNTKKIVFLALLIAMQIVLERFLAIHTPIVRVTLGFLPIAFAGIMLGPKYAMLVGALSDVIGFFLFPTGVYFPGFTISGALRGSIFGIVHYGHKVTLNRTIISAALSTIVCDLILNTIWIKIVTENPYSVIFAARLIKTGVMIPVSIILIILFWKAISPFLSTRSYWIT